MKKAGVWIDQKEAKVITLTENSEEMITISSEIDPQERIPGEGKQYGRFGGQFLSLEKNKQNQQKEHLKRYLNRVQKSLEDKDEIMLFGPAQIKNELGKLLQQNQNLSDKLREIKSAEKMTENQKVAFVRDYFA